MKITSIQNNNNLVQTQKNTSNPIDVSFCAKKEDDSFEREITLYLNPFTRKEDIEFSEMVDVIKNYGVKNYLEMGINALDPDGKCNDVVYRILDLFYSTRPVDIETKLIYAKELLIRLIKLRTTELPFHPADCNPNDFLDVIKNNDGNFSKKNEQFLYDVLRVASKDHKDDGIFVSQVVKLINLCKDDSGEIDSSKAKMALKVLKKTKLFDRTADYVGVYFQIPEEKRKHIVSVLNSVVGDEKNKLLNFPVLTKFCFDEEGNLNQENLDYYKKMLSVSDTEFGNWTFGLANTYPATRDFILEFIETSKKGKWYSDNLPWESYWLGQYLLSVNLEDDTTEVLLDNARNYYNTKGTFDGLKDFFSACVEKKYSNEDEEAYYTEFYKELFDAGLRLLEEEFAFNLHTGNALSGTLPIDILSGELRVETLPYSKRVELKEILSQMKHDSAFEEQLDIMLQIIEDSLLLKDISIPISKDIKHEFISKILKSEQNKYSHFESVLVESIPYLESLENGLLLEYSKEELLADLYGASFNKEKFEQLIKKLGITITSEFEDEGVNIPASYDGFIDTSKLDLNDEYEAFAYKMINKYLFDNSVFTNSNELDKYINTIIKAVPEFINIIGKQQHGTQKHTLDIHCLLAMAYSVENPEYMNLTQSDKAVLKFSALLHDIAKKEHIIDTGHQYLSSEYVKNICSKIFAHPRAQERICEFVCNHHWLADYSKQSKGGSAAEIAIKFRRNNDFAMAKIMAKSDLMAVSHEFYEHLKDALDPEKLQYIERNIDMLDMSANILPTDRIVNKRKLQNHIQVKDGVEYKVINLKDIPEDADMSEYGFEYAKKKQDLRLCVHMIDTNTLASDLSTLKTLENPANNGVLSESILTPSVTRTYKDRKHGLMLSHPASNILAANYENIYSGYNKDLPSFVSKLLEDGKIIDCRSNFINDFLGYLDYDGPLEDIQDDYVKFYRDVLSKITSYEQIKDDDEFQIGEIKFDGAALRANLTKIRDDLIDFEGETHNEIIAYLPTIEAVISKSNSLDELPQELLDFANTYNLPIVLI